MPKATLSSRYQITIPREIRDALAVGPGDEVVFVLAEDGTVSIEAATTDIRDMRGTVRAGSKAVTVRAMKKAIREAATRS